MAKLNKKLIVFVFLFLFLLFLTISITKAQVDFKKESQSLRILFKGTLTDNKGNLLPAGKYNFKFLIYDEELGGNLVWQEMFVGLHKVKVGTDGYFQVILGRYNKINFDFNAKDYYLTLSVGGLTDELNWDQEMIPRRRIITLEKFMQEQKIKEEDNLITELLKHNFLSNATNAILVFDTDDLKKVLQELKTEPLQNDSLKAAAEEMKMNLLNSSLQATSTPEQNEGFWSSIKNLFVYLINKISAIFTEIKTILAELIKLNEKIDKLNEKLVENQLATSTFFNNEAVSTATNSIETSNTQLKNQITGHIETLLDSNALFIREPFVKENSIIFITFLNDPMSNWWISKRVEGEGFEISFSHDGVKVLNFDYWIINHNLPTRYIEPNKSETELNNITSSPEESMPEQATSTETLNEAIVNETLKAPTTSQPTLENSNITNTTTQAQ